MSTLLLALPLLAPLQSCPPVQSFGQGCAGTGGAVPQLALAGDLASGPDLSLELSNVHGGSVAVLVVGDSQVSLPVGGGCTLWVNPAYIAPAVLVPGVGAGQGALSVPIPGELALAPIDLSFQYFAHHPATGLTSTDGLGVSFGPSCASTKVLAEMFATGTEAASDAARNELLGRELEGIAQLMALGLQPSSSAVYPGLGPDLEESSWMRTSDTPISTMAFYTVEGILSGLEAPYRSHILVDDTFASADPDADAIALYSSWWQASQGKSIDQLRAGPRALDGSNLSWAGGAVVPAIAPLGTGAEDPLKGIKNDGCPTPIKKGKGGKAPVKPGTVPEAGKFIFCGRPFFKPGVGVTVATPFNCLAWAVGCFKDRWLQPHGMLGADDIANNHGFNELVGPFLPSSTPGAGVMGGVMLIYDHTGKWMHAMKWDPATGTWSSKNGQGQTSSNIKPGQVKDFLDSIPGYRVPPGKFRGYRLFSK